MIEMTGSDATPPVQIEMGELAALASIFEGMLLAHETNAPIKDGVLWPSVVTLYSAMAMQSEFNGRMLEMVRELVGVVGDLAAVIGRGFRQSGDRADDRALHALGLDGRAHRAPRWCGCSGISSAPSSAAAISNTRSSTAALRSS